MMRDAAVDEGSGSKSTTGFRFAKSQHFSFSRRRPDVGPPSLLTSGHEMYLSPAVKQRENEINGVLDLGPRLRKHPDLLQFPLCTFIA
jgi:hypothetical protein